MIFRGLSIIALICAGHAALAQDGGNGISFTLGVGPKSSPEYFGAEDNQIGPGVSFDLEQLELGPISRDGQESLGFGVSGSARFIRERSSDDHEELDGLEDVDSSFEIGGGLDYTGGFYNVFADVRYGVIGHEALVAEVGGDLIYRPVEKLTISAGPRLFWGSDDYAQTYFGVTEAESATSSFDAFDADGGWLTAGVEAEANYQLNDNWGLTGKLRYDQLQEDAADSPITQSEDQVTGSILVTRKITFGF